MMRLEPDNDLWLHISGDSVRRATIAVIVMLNITSTSVRYSRSNVPGVLIYIYPIQREKSGICCYIGL